MTAPGPMLRPIRWTLLAPSALVGLRVKVVTPPRVLAGASPLRVRQAAHRGRVAQLEAEERELLVAREREAQGEREA
jgi:hypothetical protein